MSKQHSAVNEMQSNVNELKFHVSPDQFEELSKNWEVVKHYITCLYDELYIRPKTKIVNAAIQDKEGINHIGKSHSEILSATISFASLRGCAQGFITDNGIFVNRELAAQLAFSSGQITEQKSILYSEDLL